MKLLNNQKGIALFLVLWVLILLSVIVGEFSHAMRTEINIARNFRDEAQAYYFAQAGIYQAIFELIKTETKPPQIQGVEFDKKQDKSRWRINADIAAENFAEGSFKVKIDNESGKFDLNAADEDVLRIMLAPFKLDAHQKDVIVDSVQDWREEGNFHRLNGAKNDYYQSLPEPYSCKNAEFDSTEELLLVRGMTQEIYDGLKEMITVYRGDTYEDKRSVFGGGDYAKTAGKKKININAASAEVLRLLPKMTEEIIQNIMEYRKDKDFESEAEIAAVLGPGVQTALMPYITLKKYPFFTITSMGMLQDSDIRQVIRVLVEIDPAMDKKYRIVQWSDRYDFSKQSRN